GRKTEGEQGAILQRLQGQPAPRRARAGPPRRPGRPTLAAATKQLPERTEIEHGIIPQREKNQSSLRQQGPGTPRLGGLLGSQKDGVSPAQTEPGPTAGVSPGR